MLRARMGIRAHPTLTKSKASKGQTGTQSRGCAGQSVRPSPHAISQTSVGKLLNRSIFDPFKPRTPGPLGGLILLRYRVTKEVEIDGFANSGTKFGHVIADLFRP
jgi:hypothetical protein